MEKELSSATVPRSAAVAGVSGESLTARTSKAVAAVEAAHDVVAQVDGAVEVRVGVKVHPVVASPVMEPWLVSEGQARDEECPHQCRQSIGELRCCEDKVVSS